MASIPANDVLVSFRGVQKSYDGESLIVKDLNLDIRKGEFLTLLGPSGSGKTTSLMMLAGFETPTNGEILLAGRSINNVPPHKRDIGMVFQNYALFPHMTVAENLAFPLTVRGMNKTDISERVKRALSMVQLDSFRNRYPAQLSGGQQQRVALARALVFEPQLVLMDEPLGALDKQLREHMQMEIKHIHQRLGVTVVYVTHDQGEALTMSDRVAVFHQGEIQQIAPPRELYEFPCNTFVANFIGENNRINGQLLSRDGDQCVVVLPRGEKVQALAVKVGQPGEPVTLSVRPERVRLNSASESCANRFSGRVEEFIYLGDHVRIRLEVCGHSDFFVKQPIAELDPSLSVGDVVPLGWHVEHVRALDPVAVDD
ncbi:ABC transporter ATP-binding protein [Metapseudomonas otitidis]|jgi:putative spermidine/putrescine transport system ATP-binding protein|uniref:Spermidine/putrescine import ATP-binding protein PotA n=1 Tax=Metapseudomonas otitidis TaxID=319939 RepID=A0A1I0SR56_9GAMM|nr:MULTISPECIES: ABC transporter ATP-binding protein [Pseudomonas]MDL5600034.1 ABC transporter ATP-binding protein [Bacillus subtilis]KIV71669.1 Putrescine transport ATP-binding protein PotA [Pseudomonas sp. FeS53a]MBO2928236.1 ABC transporter ATP-binding protein [Pseudomonas otitidis]MCO7555938.1 ABC transporter ATP-binding protein [Pseudomonas otitidis]MCP1618838.1 putative spermidine/putrescine transport system ATP-binding protein [Pseudomonas otitidis]